MEIWATLGVKIVEEHVNNLSPPKAKLQPVKHHEIFRPHQKLKQ